MPNPAYDDGTYRKVRRAMLAANLPCSMSGCTRPATTVDHIHPLALGGSNDPDNLRPLCRHHNSVLGGRLVAKLRRPRSIGHQSRQW